MALIIEIVMKAEAEKIPVVPITKLRRRSPGGYEVVAVAKDNVAGDSLLNPGDIVIWSCVAGAVVLIVWMVFGIGHAIAFVYQAVGGSVDMKTISKDLQSIKPQPTDAGPIDQNVAAADVEMDRKSEEMKKNFNDAFGPSIGRFFDAANGLKIPVKKNKEVGTF